MQLFPALQPTVCALTICLWAVWCQPALGGARPADVPGWEGARWGMTEAELDAALGPRLDRLPGRWEYGNAYATRAIHEARVGDLRFRAFFQMQDGTEALQQVLLERRREDSNRYRFEDVKATLEVAYGPADRFCLRPRRPGQERIADMTWRFPTTTIHATFFDFHSFGIMFKDARLPVDTYLTDRERRRVHRRSLPKKLLVRFHPSERNDLEPKGDCLEVPEPE